MERDRRLSAGNGRDVGSRRAAAKRRLPRFRTGASGWETEEVYVMTARPVRRALLPLILVLGLVDFSLAQEPEAAPEQEEFIDINIQPEGITLEQAIQWASESTGRPFKFNDTDIKNKPRIMVSGIIRIPKSRIYEFWQAIFVIHGFAMLPMGPGEGDFIAVEVIQTSPLIKQRAAYVSVEDLPRMQAKAGEVIMTTIPLKYVRVENVRGAVTQLLTNRQSEFAQEVQSANALIVVGFAPTVYALYQILMAMDVPMAAATLKFEIIRLQHAVAEELQPIIADLITSTSGAGGQPRVPRPQPGGEGILPGQEKPEPKLIADPRTNSLVVYAVESDMNEIKRLIAALDTEVSEIESNIRIYFLKNTNATDMEETLRDLLQQGTTRSGRATGIRPQTPGTAPTTTSAIGQEVSIVADEHNNALLITATKTRYDEIEPIIRELDKRRPQVLVQAAIAELSDTDLKNIAVELTAIEGGDDRYRFGAASAFGLSTITTSSATGGTGGTGTGGGSGTPGAGDNGGILDDLVRVPFLSPDGIIGFSGLAAGIFERNLNVPLLVALLETNTRVNLLSNASVLTNDNEESRILVGREVPTSSNQLDPSGATRSGFQNYEEANLELTISPHISNDNYLRLEVHLLVEAFQGVADPVSGLPPPKTKREFEGSVTVPNGRTVVIGGLVQDNVAETISQVPFLGDIPVVGELFKSSATNVEKTTLYLFVTPTIFTEFRPLEEISYDRKLEILKLEGNIRLVDPDFRVIELDNTEVDLESLEKGGSLDLPRYVPVVPVEDSAALQEVKGIPLKPARSPEDSRVEIRQGGTVKFRGGQAERSEPNPPPQN